MISCCMRDQRKIFCPANNTAIRIERKNAMIASEDVRMLLASFVMRRLRTEAERKRVVERLHWRLNDEPPRGEATDKCHAVSRLDRVVRPSVHRVWSDLNVLCRIVTQRGEVRDL